MRACEGKDGLDHVTPGDEGFARRKRCRINAESPSTDVACRLHQFARERSVAAECRKMPGEAERDSPMAV
jgi:hypothetical protein